MSSISIAAILSVTGIAVFGFNNISLAILFALTFSSIVLGKLIENWFEAKEKKRFEKQVEDVMNGKS